MNSELYLYTKEGAHIYESLGITRTTYEIQFKEVKKLLGNIEGKTFADFGCGAGRSTFFLRSLGAEKVYGFDHDTTMIAKAREHIQESIEFISIATNDIPLSDHSVDGVLSSNVFVEIRTREDMRKVCLEVARILRPSGIFVLTSTRPDTYGHIFRNFEYAIPDTSIKSGDRIICTIKMEGKNFSIDDTYWIEQDYCDAIAFAGMRIERVSYPTADSTEQWETDERDIAPFIVIKSTKPYDEKK